MPPSGLGWSVLHRSTRGKPAAYPFAVAGHSITTGCLMNEVPIERLRQLLDYDPSTGTFTWKVTYGNARAGVVAGGLHPTYFYWKISIGGKMFGAHRLAWAMTYGVWPPNQIDHINGIRNDNRISNLRLATIAQNSANARRPLNKSGYRGVSFHRERKKWMVYAGGKYIGYFTCPKAAHEAYVAASRATYGEFARAE